MKSFLAFAALALAVNVTPGPGMAFIASQALTGNARSAIAAQGGLAAGILAWVVATAAGVAQLLHASPGAFQVLKGAGTVYVAVLGVRLVMERAPTDSPAATGGRLRATFAQGLLTNLLNPYIGAFLVAFLPLFVDSERGPVAGQIILLGLYFTVSASAVNLSVAALVHRSALSLVDARWVGLRRIAGILLVLFAIRMAIAQVP